MFILASCPPSAEVRVSEQRTAGTTCAILVCTVYISLLHHHRKWTLTDNCHACVLSFESQHGPYHQQPTKPNQTKWGCCEYRLRIDRGVYTRRYCWVNLWKVQETSLRAWVNECTVRDINEKFINICLKLLVHNKSLKTFLQIQVAPDVCESWGGTDWLE